MNDGKFYSALSDNKIIKFDITTGLPGQTLLDGNGLPTAIVVDDYSSALTRAKVYCKPRRRAFTAGRLFIVYIISIPDLFDRFQRGGNQSYATFPPDGSTTALMPTTYIPEFHIVLEEALIKAGKQSGHFIILTSTTAFRGGDAASSLHNDVEFD